jgi:hypothetical protein
VCLARIEEPVWIDVSMQVIFVDIMFNCAYPLCIGAALAVADNADIDVSSKLRYVVHPVRDVFRRTVRYSAADLQDTVEGQSRSETGFLSAADQPISLQYLIISFVVGDWRRTLDSDRLCLLTVVVVLPLHLHIAHSVARCITLSLSASIGPFQRHTKCHIACGKAIVKEGWDIAASP